MSLKEQIRSGVIKKGTAPKKAPPKADWGRKPPGANTSNNKSSSEGR